MQGGGDHPYHCRRDKNPLFDHEVSGCDDRLSICCCPAPFLTANVPWVSFVGEHNSVISRNFAESNGHFGDINGPIADINDHFGDINGHVDDINDINNKNVEVLLSPFWGQQLDTVPQLRLPPL